MPSIEPRRRYGIDITRERDPNDKWSGQDTHTNHYVDGISLTRDDRVPDVVSEFPVEGGVEYYLVYGLYSTGDSFSYDSGNILFIDLFQNLNQAEACKIALRKHFEESKDPDQSGPRDHCRKATYPAPTEGKKSIHVPWLGYFENLQDVVIKSVQIID